jgi:peptidoglycan hydrolase-like protein with peptidoglycan-binding domain
MGTPAAVSTTAGTGLQSKLFTVPPDSKLNACLVRDDAHITPGSRGDHVKRIQVALNQLSNVFLIIDGWYGPKTAAAVKAYKSAPHRDIRQTWQQTADDIVGIRTLKWLDKEMYDFENFEPGVESRYISMTAAGAPHDHSRCPKYPYASAPGPDNRAQHRGTPINPQGYGRKINIGGEGETTYLGFQDFSTKGDLYNAGPGRPYTESLPSSCASDICMRAAPLNDWIMHEISRLALPACRFTLAANTSDPIEMRFLRSVGTVIEHASIASPQYPTTISQDLVVFVVAMRGDGHHIDFQGNWVNAR